MSTNLRTVVRVAAVVSMVLACVGTAQAAPTSVTIPNYNFQSWDEWDRPSGTGSWTMTHYGSLADGQMTPSWTSGTGPQAYPTGWWPAQGTNSPYSRMWNPSSTSFATAGGNGALPGTAAGSQCFYNSSTDWATTDIDLITTNNTGTQPTVGVTTLQANRRYTLTVAIASPLGATIMNGSALGFANIDAGAEMVEHDDMYPNGWYTYGANNGTTQNMAGFLGCGRFGDVSLSMNSNDFIGSQFWVGDNLVPILDTSAGVCWSNVRMISQNWFPLYAAGNFTWNNNSTSNWSTTPGGPYTGSKWTQVSGRDADAVFETTTGTATVTVSGTVSANSLNFNADWTALGTTAPGYTWLPSNIINGGTINLTGDATITVGAGTNYGTGSVEPAPGGSNAGGGCALISSTLSGSNGMYKAGAGNLILTGANNYTGGTTVGGGTLQIGNGGTSGSIPGDANNGVNDLANLAFNRSDAVTYGGNISGNGSVDILNTQNGANSKTIFTGTNTYGGITTIHAHATLQIGNGGTTGSVSGDVVNNGNLVFNRSDKVTYTGTIYDGSALFATAATGSGTSTIYNEVAQHGTLTQAGTGRLILTNSQSDYSGVTNVQNGALQLDGASPTMNVLTNAGGVNITGGMLILDYTSGSDPASLVASLLTAEAASHFQTGQIRDTALPAGETLTWADSPTINGQTYTNEVVVMITPVPEPSTLALLGIGAVSLLAYAWRRCRS